MMSVVQNQQSLEQGIVISAQNLRKNFGLLAAVDGISFSIKKQEIVGVLGPNGAGKTTTIRLLTGLYRVLNGSSIQIFNEDITMNPLLYKSLFGIVPEISNAFLDYTVLQNLQFTGQIFGLTKKEIKERSASLLQQYGLTDKAKTLTNALSKGLKQRLNFCIALLHDPPILIFDEPTAGLDPISVRVLREQILHLREAGKTILLTTHDMQEAQKICDRVLIINKGKIIVDETPDALRAKFGNGRMILFKPAADLPETFKAGLIAIFSRGTSLKLLKNGYYQCPSKDPVGDIVKIHTFFQDNGISISDLKLEETSLEDIFIQLIQKERESNE
ncbi:MAG: ATP-binding protein [Promethearchaeota archaeon CR_4]|nr:MAG: ATP-binding protein [Candidatus Lokiarchaeota archaeon CR_4]